MNDKMKFKNWNDIYQLLCPYKNIFVPLSMFITERKNKIYEFIVSLCNWISYTLAGFENL